MAKKKINTPEPEGGLKFIDVHSHLPFPRQKKDTLPSDNEQFLKYFKDGGLYLINSPIDMRTLNSALAFMKSHEKNYGITCGWAPQTVTYTPTQNYPQEWKKWIDFVTNNQKEYLAIGEIGLDFHHAKTLEKRNKQVEEFRKILELTKSFEKPYVLHVRNAADHEKDKQNPDHKFNNKDGANQEILKILKEYHISPKKVMWHCFSGPDDYGPMLAKQGFKLSVPSSAFGFNRWQRVSKDIPLESLVTETDSFYQHPFKYGPINIPSNVRYSIAALAYTHNVSQKEVSDITVKNAIDFFKLKIDQ